MKTQFLITPLRFFITKLVLLTSTFTWAAETPKYKVENKVTDFYENRNLAILSSKGCPELKKGTLCSHLKFLENLKIDTTKMKDKGVNLGSIACKDVLKKEVYLGADLNGNEITFCKIDDYYLDLGTLDYYASKNLGLISKSRRRK